MPFKDYFSQQAEQYRNFRPGYPESMIQSLVHHCPRRQTALDIATGNGQVATALSPYFDHVLACDASHSQVRQAASAPNINYYVGLAEQPSVATNSIDLVTVGQALHWFNQPEFFNQIGDCLTTHGVLATWCYRRFTSRSKELNQCLNHIYAELLADFWPPERQLVDQGYQSIEFPYPTQFFDEFEIRLTWSAEQLIGYIMSWSATQGYLAEVTRLDQVEKINEFEAAIGLISQRLTGTIELNWPISLFIGTPNQS